MQFKVWNKKNRANAKKDDVFFRLVESDDKLVLKVVDSDGDMIKKGNVLSFCPEVQAIVLMGNIAAKSGLKSDVFGHVLTVTESEIHAYVNSFEKDHAPIDVTDLVKDEILAMFKKKSKES